MKLSVLIISSAVLGILLGLGVTRLEFSQLEKTLEIPEIGISQTSNKSASEAPAAKDLKGEPRVVVVNGEAHDFGLVDPNSTVSHDFLFKNEGAGVLKLEKGGTSCTKCTISNIGQEFIAPGETAKITVESTLIGLAPYFEQTAEIHTSDPDRPVIQLRVKGRRATSLQASPKSIMFLGVSSDLSSEASVRLVGFRHFDFKITGYELLNETNAKYFDIRIQPLSEEELASDAGAKYGFLLHVATKPGLPLGGINQTILLKTNSEEKPTFEIPIEGSVESDISIYGGKRFNTFTHALTIGHVDRNKGHTAQLLLRIKGPHRGKVKLSVAKVDPAASLKASIGEMRTSKKGEVLVYPITIEVLKESPIINKTGTDSKHYGVVMIHTTHPTAKEVPIYVRFAVVK